jgi:hypothetical protein
MMNMPGPDRELDTLAERLSETTCSVHHVHPGPIPFMTSALT